MALTGPPADVRVGGTVGFFGGITGAALFDTQYQYGGWRVVWSVADRDLIPPAQRQEGMLVKCNDTGLTYVLGSDLTTWTTVGGSIGGAGDANKLAYWTDSDTLDDLPVQYYSSGGTYPNTVQYYVSNDDGTEWPTWSLHTSSASPAADDVIGEYKFTGYDDGSNVTEYATMRGVITDPTTPNEYGRMDLIVMQNGSEITGAQLLSDIDGSGADGFIVTEKFGVGTDSVESGSSVQVHGTGTCEIRTDGNMEVWTDLDMEFNSIQHISWYEMYNTSSVTAPSTGYGRIHYKSANAELKLVASSATYPIVKGPTTSSTTNNALPRWDGTLGAVIKDSNAILDDTGNLTVSRGDTTNVSITYGNSNSTVIFGASTDTTPSNCHFGHDGTDTVVRSLDSILIQCWCATNSITLSPAGGGVIIANGQDFQLGNSYTAGAPTPTGYLVVKDSAGTSYKIPAEAL